MTPSNIAVFGIYNTPNEAERGVEHLEAAGFPHAAISVLLPDADGTQNVGIEKTTHAAAGGTTGATAGGVVGGTFGLLAGLGALAIPGIGPLLAVGPLLAAVAGFGVGGAVGGVVGTLVGYGMPEYEAKRFEGRVKAGHVLVAVHCDTEGEIDTATDSLKATGAEDVTSAAEDSTVVNDTVMTEPS